MYDKPFFPVKLIFYKTKGKLHMAIFQNAQNCSHLHSENQNMIFNTLSHTATEIASMTGLECIRSLEKMSAFPIAVHKLSS